MMKYFSIAIVLQTAVRVCGRVLLFCCLFSSPLATRAQCDRVGWIASEHPDCGLKIIDLENGEVLRAVKGYSSLEVGKTFSFSTASADPLSTCPNETLKTYELSCISDTIPCKADFVPFPHDQHPMTFRFVANLFDTQNQTCQWDFGDGTTGTGMETQHTYSKEGIYSVRLLVEGIGCSSERMMDINVNMQNAIDCHFGFTLTAVGHNMIGKVVPNSGLAGTLKNTVWYFSKSNQIIAQTPDFQYLLSDYGVHNVCVEIVSETPDGDICASTQCKEISIHPPGCHQPNEAMQGSLCPTFFAPVCGCDGVTYANECEALVAGVTTWWAGQCGSQVPGNCLADVDVEILGGDPDNGFDVRFFNLASGDFAYLQLDYGDGNPLLKASNWATHEHHYAKAGTYLATMTIWKNGGCVSSISKVVNTDLATAEANQQPQTSEHVLPGDANGDGKANVYDLLNIGVGYFSGGSPRPFSSPVWTPQIAPNWDKWTGLGTNFKHLDCDGNGIINELDPNLVSLHYQDIQSTVVPLIPDAPKIWLDFSQNPDTIFVDPNNPKQFEVSADVMVAEADLPIFDLYGLAFAVKYPYFVNQDPEVNYNSNSNFGFSNDILWLPKNLPFKKQLDLAFVRKNGQSRNGYFKLAKITFKTDYIIIVDVVYRDDASPKPFTTDIRGLLAIDPNGLPKDLTIPQQIDTVWIKLKSTVGTSNTNLDRQVVLFPNPVIEDQFSVQLVGDLRMESVRVYNTLGQIIAVPTITNERYLNISTESWANGRYSVHLQTQLGMVEKSIVVNRK